MNNKELLDYLRTLECELHQPRARTDPKRLDELLHDGFVEFGRDGSAYNKAQIIAHLADEDGRFEIVAQNFALHRVTTTTALLSYQSARAADNGDPHFAQRASLWVSTSQGWRMYYHQGTPIDGFSEAAER